MLLQILKRDRFSLIMKFIYLNDNSAYVGKGQPSHNPLFKLQPFLNCLLENFQKVYTLGREISINEQMISFKGHLAFLQYMPTCQVGSEGICALLQ